MFASLHLT